MKSFHSNLFQATTVFAGFITVLFIPQSARAANANWIGTTDAIWATATNWSAATPATGNVATFNAAAGIGGAVIDVTGVTISQIVFDTANAAAYTIGSGGVGVQTYIQNDGGAVTVNAAVATDQLVNANITLGTDATTKTHTINNYTLANSLTFAGNLTGGTGGTAGTKTLNVTGSGAVDINGIIDKGGATTLNLAKSGYGTLTLNGANTYGGTTNVNGAGSLRLGSTGSLAATAVTIASGASFGVTQNADGASNSMGGSLNLASGSVFTMADGFISTLNITGATTFGSGATSSLIFDLGGLITAADKIVATDAATISTSGGKITVNATGVTPLASGSYNLITAVSGLAPGANDLQLANTKVSFGGNTYSLSLASTDTTVDLTVGPFVGTDQAYWTGAAGAAWNAGVTNFNTLESGGVSIGSLPDAVTDVFFTTSSPSATNLSNTLGVDTTINSLTFVNGSSSVTIGAGNTLTLAAAGPGNFGITNASFETQTIHSPIVLGQTQTWTNSSVGTLVIGGSISGAGGLITQSGDGSITLSGLSGTPENNYAGTTTIDQGILAIAAGDPVFTGGLTFGATAGDSSTGALDLNNSSATFAGPLFVQSNSSSNNTITIGSGKTLQLNGAVTVGTNGASPVITVTNLAVDGAGSLAIGTELTPTDANIQLGGNIFGATAISNAATLDMSGLATFTANLGTGQCRVGDAINGNGVALTGQNSTLILAMDNTINAASLNTESLSVTAVQTIKLGTGTNTVNVGTLSVGAGSGGGRATGLLTFNDAGLGTLKVRSQADPVNGRANLNIVNMSSGASTNTVGTVDLNGHSVDLLFDKIVIAQRTAGTNTGSPRGTFSFNEGTLDANDLTACNKQSVNSSTFTGTVNLGGTGVSTFNCVSNPLRFGFNSGSKFSTGTLNVSGTTCAVSVAANAGNSIILGNASVVGGTATGEIAITGGTLTVAGDIIRGVATGTSAATLNVNGGTLDMSGAKIGGSLAAGNLTATTFASGTLKNVAEINNGGVLNKTTVGVLSLAGTNSYSGATTVTLGTLQLGGDNVIPNGTGKGNLTLTADSTCVLDLNAFSETINGLTGAGTIDTLAGGTPVLTVGDNDQTSVFTGIIQNTAGALALTKVGSGTLTLSGANTYSGETSVNAGTLSLGLDDTLSDSAAVRVAASGATLDLNFAGDDVVDTFFIGGVQQASGIWGSTTSGAAHTSALITGTGLLNVTNGPPAVTGYASWANSNGIPGQPASGNQDNDTMTNGMEYALGTNPTVPNGTPGTVAGNLLTFVKGGDAIANADVTWVIETSTTLALGSWSPVVTQLPGNTDPSIFYTLPTGSPKVFSRLKTTIAP